MSANDEAFWVALFKEKAERTFQKDLAQYREMNDPETWESLWIWKRENWVRDPADYPDFPPPRVRSAMKWSPAGPGHLANWYRFFSGLRDTPPGKSGLFRPRNPDGSLHFGKAESK